MQLERLGVPIALIAGLIGLCLGPYGPLSILPEEVMHLWTQLPSPLLTLVFATLMLGRAIPRKKSFFYPVAAQSLLALLIGFGQYVVGGLIVLFILIPKLGVDPLMGSLIEIGFEGGHGAAAIMGKSLDRLGFPEGLDLGLAMATIGLLSSTVIGSGLVVLGRFQGWLSQDEGGGKKNLLDDVESSITPFEQARILVVNLALTGSAVALGVLMLSLLRFISSFFGGILEEVVLAFPVFPLALLASLFIRFVLEATDKTEVVSPLLQREIGILSTDLLIATAMAGLNLPLLRNDWFPLTVLAIAGLTWNLFGMFVFAKLILKKEWFERSVAEFGNATGVAASGLLLLRLADPRNLTETLPIFSVKQLLLQPLLSGGLITVIAPLFITKLGLLEWTEICSAITALLLLIAILFPFLSSFDVE